jgi:hypothetical protein
VKALEKVALERRDHLSGANAEYGRFADEVKGQMGKLEAQRAAAESQVQAHTTRVDEAERVFQRADARKKRLYIEIRAIVEASEKARTAPPPPQAARLAELERLVAEQRPEHEAAEAAFGVARAARKRAEEEVNQVARTIRDADRRARAQDDAYQKQLGTRSAGVSEVEAERARALADVGLAVLAARGRLVDVPAATLSPIELVDAKVAARALELEKHVRAMDAHDASALRAGIGILAGLVALLLLAILVLALR